MDKTLTALLLFTASLTLQPQGFAQGGHTASARVFFSKSFPGSKPAYFEISVDSSGRAVYRESPEEDDPVEFALGGSELEFVFGLIKKLDYFQRPLASNKKVAFTGDKVFRFENGAGEKSEVRFAFTDDPDARALVEWFEKAGETERYLIELERVTRFDRLGVNKALLMFQAAFDKGRIVAPEQFLPILKEIAGERKFVHIAQARAASLVERIEGNASGQ